MASKLTQLAKDLNSTDFNRLSKESFSWMKKKISQLRNPSSIAPQIAREKFRQVTRLSIGKLYCFYYNPKGASTLPYYDIFPMVLVLDKYNDGFLGLNFHYLPYTTRAAFLDQLMNSARMDDDDNPERLRVTYDILSASKRYKAFQPCLKRYLYSHVQSHLMAIESTEWEVATMLPLHQFQKATTSHVWQESLREIRK
jgi:hypothetical protein